MICYDCIIQGQKKDCWEGAGPSCHCTVMLALLNVEKHRNISIYISVFGEFTALHASPVVLSPDRTSRALPNLDPGQEGVLQL